MLLCDVELQGTVLQPGAPTRRDPAVGDIGCVPLCDAAEIHGTVSQAGAPARTDAAVGDLGCMGRDAERGGCGALPGVPTARARPLLWLRLTPHRMSHSRVLFSTAISSLSLCLPMGSRLSLTEPCASPSCTVNIHRTQVRTNL